jgi:signal recognition particle subunit SRP68
MLSSTSQACCRRFCTRRIHRIRVALKLTHGRRNFQNKRVTLANMTEERHFHILLLEMERVRLQL